VSGFVAGVLHEVQVKVFCVHLVLLSALLMCVL
jgi:hypothetical protein